MLRKGKKPKLHEEFQSEIGGIGKEGDRICKYDGFVVIVKECNENVGENIWVKVTRVLDILGFGEMVK